MKDFNVFEPCNFGWIELFLFFIISFLLFIFTYKINRLIAKKGGYLLEVFGVIIALSIGVVYFLTFSVGKDFFIGRFFIRCGNENIICYSSFVFSFAYLFLFPIKKNKKNKY
ncbi:hypothetical protein [Providencia sneebia]|uniref:Uncharacterized protein n=1 Tax=Providencia sneebia DSM 19967 TaxID=1141660 RepID=K8WTU9_9GAMM|nr:hypothetical protein [Providencia sneebia]EKT60847.1 hypothetical protein OO7_02081 [Providencia sneebia DSM 19967]